MKRLTQRLTERDYDAELRIDAVYVKDHDYVEAAHRLADYVDTGLTPEEIKQMHELLSRLTICRDCKYRQDRLYCRLRNGAPFITCNTDFCSMGESKE